MPADLSALSRLPDVELIKIGSWQALTGTWNPTPADIAAAVDAQNCPAIRPPIIKLGHVDSRFDGEPALGWFDNLRAADGGNTLVGDQVALPWLAQVQAAAYPSRSIEGNYNHRCAQGHVHPFVLTAVALLGVTPPAVTTIRNLNDLREHLGVAASEVPDGAEPVQVTIAAGRHSYDEDEHPRDGNGRWARAAGGRGQLNVDRLNLAGRIQLQPGQDLIRSDAVQGDDTVVALAWIDGPDGPTLRVGAGIAEDDQQRWAAANRGSTVELGAAGAVEFADAVEQMRAAANTGRARLRALEDRAADLEAQRRTILRRQWPELSTRDARRLDTVDANLADLNATIARRADRLAGAAPDSWTSRTESRAQARDVAARDALLAERATLTANPVPLSDADRAELARIDTEAAQVDADYAAESDRVIAEGAVPGAWGDLVYEVYLDDAGEPSYRVAVRPEGAGGDWQVREAGTSFTADEFARLLSRVRAVRPVSSEVSASQEVLVADVAAAAEVHIGAMVALVPAAEDAARIAVDGGEAAGQLHVTLLYLGDAAAIPSAARQDVIDHLTTAVNGMPIVEADGFALSVFNPGTVNDRDTCITLGLSGDLLDAVHTLVSDAVGWAAPEQHAPWHAHITLAYTDDLSRLAGLVDRVGPVTFDRVRIAFAGATIDIPLIDDDWDPADVDDLADVAAAEGDRNQLKRYWLEGAGLKKWATKKHPWTSLFRQLRKHMDVERAKRTASDWYREHFGHMPNQKGNKVAASDPPPEPIPDRPMDPVPNEQPDTTTPPDPGGVPVSPAAEPEPTEPEGEDPVSTLSTDVRSRLGLSDTDDDAAVLSALDALKTKADTLAPDPQQVAASAAVAEENAALRAKLDEQAKEVSVLASQMSTVTAELAAAKAEKAASVKASVLDEAQRQGKFSPAQRDQWATDYDEAPGAVTRILASIAPGTAVPIAASGHTGTGDENVGDQIDADYARMFNVTEKAGA